MTFDPFENRGPIERVNYATGMMLSAEDFRAEQKYHRNRMAQLMRFALGKGTLAGLSVESDKGRSTPVTDGDEYKVFVRPGLAIDGLGQLIEVTRDYSISLKRWVESKAELVDANINTADNSMIFDILLSARDIGRTKTPSFADGPFDALDSVTASRLEDGFLLELVPRKIEPVPAFTAVSAQKPLDQVLQGWKPVTEQTLVENQKILLARIRNCVVQKVSNTYTIPPSKNILIDNDVRPIVFLAGRSLAKIPI
jgi:hypothetical protein